MNVLAKSKDFWLATGLSLFAALVFYFTTKPAMEHFDYTGRIALALLRGHLGLDRHPGSWLSEMVPSEGKYYSVFPLGAVLSVVPLPERSLPWLLEIARSWFLSCPSIFIWCSRILATLRQSGCIT